MCSLSNNTYVVVFIGCVLHIHAICGYCIFSIACHGCCLFCCCFHVVSIKKTCQLIDIHFLAKGMNSAVKYTVFQ